jgi:hypothetical protein
MVSGIIFVWLYSLGCSLHYNAKGLIFQAEPTPKNVEESLSIGTLDGEVFRLHLGEDRAYFAHLLGCGAEMTGIRVAKHLWVDRWTITDAGDGSAPYLGILIEKYGRLMVHDINTDTEVELVLSHTNVNLWAYVHQPVLITGIVVGPHRVQVMSVKVLSNEVEPEG